MKSLVGNGKDFEFNSKINREPMEIFKNRCNVMSLRTQTARKFDP